MAKRPEEKDGVPRISDRSETNSLDVHRKLADALQELAVERRKRKHAEYQAERFSKDSLTGLFKREAMEDAIAEEQLRVDQSKSHGGIVMAIDMRFLSLINNDHGHDAGDAAIAAFGKKLKSMMREGDLVARPSGDEFMVVMPDVVPQETSKRRRQIKEEMKSFKFDFEGQTLEVGVRMGVAKYNSDITINAAYKLADKRERIIRDHMLKTHPAPPRYQPRRK